MDAQNDASRLIKHIEHEIVGCGTKHTISEQIYDGTIEHLNCNESSIDNIMTKIQSYNVDNNHNTEINNNIDIVILIITSNIDVFFKNKLRKSCLLSRETL